MFNAKKNIDSIIEWLSEYKNRTKCRGVVLGLSGGKDSTVVAMLAKKVWGSNVVALLMPNGEQKDLSDAIHIANTLELESHIIQLETVYNNLILNIEHQLVQNNEGGKEWVHNCPTITEKAKTNIPPRLRMTTLYAVAQTLGYRVIGTGNASEAYIGWTTKFGDSAYDFNPIAHLTCTEVMEIGKVLAKELGLEERYVVKTPSDGLCGKSDEESFGFTYAQLDQVVKCREDERGVGIHASSEIVNRIEDMHDCTEHKRRMPYTMK